MRKLIFLVFFAKVLLFGADIQTQLHIKGMTCPTCTRAVKIALSNVSGVKLAKVYLNDEKAIVIMDDSVTLSSLQEAVKKVGYSAEQIK